MEKEWYKSKTIWFGILQTLAGGLTLLADALNSGTLGNPAGVTLFATGIITLIMRYWFTDTAIK